MARFDSEKNEAMDDFKLPLEKGLIDQRVIPVLDIINAHKDYYSTSSCSGRSMVIELAYPGAKNESTILGKWHDKLSKSELEGSISKWKNFQYLYFLAQSAIFHVIARDLNSAIQLRNIGESAGFKYSSIRSIKPIKQSSDIYSPGITEKYSKLPDARVTVELLSTERLNIPLGKDGLVMVDNAYIDLIIELANNSITEAHNKVKKLVETLKNQLI
ncbi:MAG: hypothetical protein KAJ51_13465 [Thermoplasmata archaeon]|nr:hypothetical protein [Thermoplasmata archaeon]